MTGSARVLKITQKSKNVKNGSIWNASFFIRARFWDNKEKCFGDFGNFDFLAILGGLNFKICQKSTNLDLPWAKKQPKNKNFKNCHITFLCYPKIQPWYQKKHKWSQFLHFWTCRWWIKNGHFPYKNVNFSSVGPSCHWSPNDNQCELNLYEPIIESS